MICVLIGFGSVAGFCFLEGMSSLALFSTDFLSKTGVADWPSMRYDSELGWVNRPNVFLADLYGPGVFLRTNARGFRGDQEVTREAPRDRLRVICSGDSFTLGYGVDDYHAWCHLLGSMDHRFDTVNLGVAGYGIDQAYLRYVRAGHSLEHAVHVFAFITLDFYRMRCATFSGYGKPLLAVKDGLLVTKNVPVPRSRFAPLFSTLLYRLKKTAHALRTAELVNRARNRLAHAGAARGAGPRDESMHFDEETWQVTAKTFETLQRMDRAVGSTLLIVYLPMDYDPEADAWRERLRAESEKSGFSDLDLVPALRQLPAQQRAAMFLSETSPAAGHYTDAGNDWVAERIHDELLRLAPVAARLAGTADVGGQGRRPLN